jgi:hypothetical protein
MGKRGSSRQFVLMTWYSVRLELARTPDFPNGSASRCYLLRVPIGADGLLERAELDADPARATVRRFWPNQPDLSGYVIRSPRGWAFSYRLGEEDDETVFHLETHKLKLGEYITLTEPDGEQLPFRVATLKPANGLPA